MANKGRQICILRTLAYIELGSIDTYLPTPTLGRIGVNEKTLLGNFEKYVKYTIYLYESCPIF